MPLLRATRSIVLLLLTPALAQTPRQQAAVHPQNVPHVDVANVLFRYSPDLSINVIRLSGSLVPTQGHAVPSFNEPDSFVIATDAAQIRMTTAQLAALMNSWLLSSPRAQIKSVRIATAGNQLVIDGTMKKGIPLPFHAAAALGLTRDNRIRIDLRQVKAAHLPVKGLLDTFGITMEDLVSQKGLKGMSVDGDAFLIDPQTAFPPPQVRGQITGVQVSGAAILLTFGKGLPPSADTHARNYIAIRGGSIRYGREEMDNADLMMIDSTPADPFDFYLRRYWCQMVAGNIRVTPDQALRIRVPDFANLPANSCRPAS
ncbi:hypothetical protein DYQ86_06150 [Acidobacteria bacterium AB60]|nr:hypothetical protein DYQ86_06150 [Acidobacteria bacterium AB60]